MKGGRNMSVLLSIILLAFGIVAIVVFGAIGFGGAIAKLLGGLAKKFDEGRKGK